MSNAIDRPDLSRSADLAEVKTRAMPQSKAEAVRDVKPAVTNPFALVETKAKVGKELESNYKQLEAAVDEIRKMADDNLMNLGFSIDRKINTHVVVVTDLRRALVLLVADDLLGAQRDARGPLGRQAERLVVAVGVQALRAPQRRRHRLDRGWCVGGDRARQHQAPAGVF